MSTHHRKIYISYKIQKMAYINNNYVYSKSEISEYMRNDKQIKSQENTAEFIRDNTGNNIPTLA